MNAPANNVGQQNVSAWDTFVNFAEGEKDGAIAKVGTRSNAPVENGHEDRSGGQGLKLEVSLEDSTWKLWRSRGLKEANNLVRQEFKKAIFGRLGIDDTDPNAEARLPPGVKKAMKLSDFNDKGKPLTARQIRTVNAAIKEWDAEHKGLETCQNLLNGLAEAVYAEQEKKEQEGRNLLNHLANGVHAGQQKKEGEELNREQKIVPVVNVNVERENSPVETAARRCFMDCCSKGRNKYFLNGKQLDFEDQSYHVDSFERSCSKAFGMRGKDDAVLQKALLAFCNTDGLSSFGAGGPFGLVRGMRPDCNPSDVLTQVKVTRTEDGGYDIAVQQNFSKIWGMRDADGNREFFDLRKPASCTTSVTYHLAMNRGDPVVSYKKKPTVKLKNYKPIGKQAFGDQTAKYLRAHFENNKTFERLTRDVAVKAKVDSIPYKEYAGFIGTFIRKFIMERLINESSAYTMESLATAFENYCKEGTLKKGTL